MLRVRAKILTGAAFLLLGTSCTDPVSAPAGPDPLLSKLAGAGFDTTHAIDIGESFIVEGDIAIAKSDIASWPVEGRMRRGGIGSPPRLQYRTSNLVSAGNAYGITVDLSAMASYTDWATATRDAMTQWNSAGSDVQLTESSTADITISPYNDPSSSTIAYASWPSGGQPGSTIHVNVSYAGSPNTSSTKLRNMVHEFGHTIGLRHSNWVALGESSSPSGAFLIPGSPSVDASSVMNGSTGGVSWSGFSVYDTYAARWLYPPINVTINGLSTVLENHSCWWTATASGRFPPFTYEWYKNGGTFVGSGDFYEHEAGPAGNDFSLRLVVTDSQGRTWSASEPITVTASAPTPWQWCN